MSEADSSAGGLFLDSSEEAHSVAAHTAPEVVPWDLVSRVVSPSSLKTKNK